MPATNYADRCLNLYVMNANTSTIALPTTLFLGVSSSTPTQGNAGGADATLAHCNITEPTIGTNGYNRLSITTNSTNWVPTGSQPANGYQMQNGVTMTLGPSVTGGWAGGATFTYFFLADASSAGNVWFFGALSPTQTVSGVNQAINFTAGALTFLIN